MFRYMLIALALMMAPLQSAFAQVYPVLRVAYGPSLPREKSPSTFIDLSGPQRTRGGEVLALRLRAPKVVTQIRLTAFSRSGRGAVLMRQVIADTALLPELYNFGNVTTGQGQNYNGLVLLPHGAFVESHPQRPLQNMEFTVEGFAADDATLLIEIETAEGIGFGDFMFFRQNGGQIGGFLDESDYHGFNFYSARRLYIGARHPSLTELANTSWVCSQFPRGGNPVFDLKTRHYFSPAEGVLQSTTDLNAQPATWILTQEGWKLPLGAWRSGCGTISNSTLVIRKSAGGNLLAENITDRQELVQACLRAGYSFENIQRWLQGRESATNAQRYVSDEIEFCRPAQLP